MATRRPLAIAVLAAMESPAPKDVAGQPIGKRRPRVDWRDGAAGQPDREGCGRLGFDAHDAGVRHGCAQCQADPARQPSAAERDEQRRHVRAGVRDFEPDCPRSRDDVRVVVRRYEQPCVLARVGTRPGFSFVVR